MTLDSILFLVGAILSVSMAVLGGIVSSKEPLVRSLFIVMGIASVICFSWEAKIMRPAPSAGEIATEIVRQQGSKTVEPSKSASAREIAGEVLQLLPKPRPVTGRELSAKDVQTIEGNLRINTPSDTGYVRISSVVGDDDAFKLAQQLAKTVFPGAGWRVVGNAASRFSPPANIDSLPTGITVSSLGGGMSDSHAATIRKAFGSIRMGTNYFDVKERNDMAVVRVMVWSHD